MLASRDHQLKIINDSSAISILIAAYHPKPRDISRILSRILEARVTWPNINIKIIHNDESSLLANDINAIYSDARCQGLEVSAFQADKNLGFGGGINLLARSCPADYYLILNQDAIPEPGAIEYLVASALQASEDIGAWEMRQIPYEHPKIYNPVSLETVWASAASLLVRASAFNDACGFESRIFMYGEDVDFSWKLRARGWKILYIPKAAVVHETYDDTKQSKPLQVAGAVYAGLALRTRYSGRKQVLEGLAMAVAEVLLIPQEFPGRRGTILNAVRRFIGDYLYYRRTAPLHRSPDFEPYYSGWSFEERRIGAFHKFYATSENPNDKPKVSVLIRTCNRPGMLREAIQSVVNQTWSNIELVIVEDGFGVAQNVVDEFKHLIPIVFKQNKQSLGRSSAGNLALELATGEWLCFLDDDDLLFADHCEVLVQACLDQKTKGSYGLAWRVYTELINARAGLYREKFRDVFPWERFDRLKMWECNLFPIQAVVFHRSLFAQYGGFDLEMNQLEDWNLWTRYTLNDDFFMVEKVTSCYRVPANTEAGLARQRELDNAYSMAKNKQAVLEVTLKIPQVLDMVRTSLERPHLERIAENLKQYTRSRSALLALYRRCTSIVRGL